MSDAFVIVLMIIIIFETGLYMFAKINSKVTRFVCNLIMAIFTLLIYLELQSMMRLDFLSIFFSIFAACCIYILAITIAYVIDKKTTKK